MSKKKSSKKFMYGVGFYWEGDSGSVGLYAFGNELFYGTLEDAKNFQSYCQNQTDNTGKNKREYKIFQLVEVPV
jgi:hypothetical protein